ncbi:hypothetical protein VE03_05783 [Pseudogymnoascus sp. 23342-1-I1]|nr:hypothetical protein VE03_05783 [Pseudogymnoascus sp. 23342-1-I1]
MCNLDDAYYTVCAHFGPRIVTTHCARGLTHNGCSKTGCWDSDVTGFSRITSLCPGCKIRTRKESGHSSKLEVESGHSGSQIDNSDIGVRSEASKGPGKDRGIWLRRLGTIWERVDDGWVRWLTMHFAR